MEIIVAKFGGSSLANANQFKKVKKIIEEDKRRRYIVPSAPGKEHADDTKITDLLYLLYDLASHKISYLDIWEMFVHRYEDICRELELNIDLKPYFDQIQKDLEKGVSKEYLSSRGEYLNGVILSEYLGFAFVDSASVMFFKDDSRLDGEKTYRALAKMAKEHEYAVIPGFYGSDPEGKIRTFTRGGGDLSGAIVARGVQASLYENWTDVSGFLAADPNIVDHPRHIDAITYQELRELSYMGAGILHDEAIFPVVSEGIPILIKNTNAPEDKGTKIVQQIRELEDEYEITGVAGRKNFSVINIEKVQMNRDLSFHRKIMSILEANDIFLEHMPSSIDSLSLIIADKYLQGKAEIVMNEIKTFVNPDSITLQSNISLIAVVGRSMINHIGASAKLFSALASHGINIQMIIQGSSEMNIIVGVDTKDFEEGIRSIYKGFSKV
ncbi:MAG: aspartate kinase [Tissierellia bacterium]|nr:aspartate kinase [Tissierellia bacterium]